MSEADEVFRGLMDPSRRAILALLSSAGRMSSGEIADQFPDIGRTAVSSHLRILRESGLVSEVKEGRNRFYSLGPNKARSAVDFLQRIYSTSVVSEDESAAETERRRGRPSRAQVEERSRSLPKVG